MLEDNIAALEGGARGLACSSGMGALNTVVFSLLSEGDHFLGSDALYGPSRTTVENQWTRFGIQASFVNTADLSSVKSELRANTRMLFIESPTNPNLKITDLAACAEIAAEAGALLVVDNTFMSPILQRPFEFGADIVMHSVTKFLNGHSDVVGGIITTRTEQLYERMYKVWYNLGATMDPHQAWLVLRGVKTLKLRVLAAQENARQLAAYLVNHPKIERVAYPGLADHPGFELHRKQADGPGSLISFVLKGGVEAGAKLLDSVKLMTLAVSLGGVETLIQHPASMTHAGMSRGSRLSAGIDDGLVRLSVGCEDADDLLADMDQALAGV
jgi:methionine-gamma-lyase